MKFGKSLSNQIVETLPEWRDKFLSYKDLKKRLKLIGYGGAGDAGAGEQQRKRRRVEGGGGGCGSPPPMTPEEAGFVSLLEAELDKFNAFFLEKEEDYIIRQKVELQDRVVRAAEMGSAEELMRVRKEIVDLHGEMVLLENYSALNYTGLVKILKKYDKRTGALIRLPFIQKVLQQPFVTTELLYKLVKECEAMLDQLKPSNEPSVPSEDSQDGKEDSDGDDKPSKPSSSLANGGGSLELDEIEDVKSVYMKSTVAALRALKEIRSGSSTVSVFSLPPLHGSDGQEEPER